MSGGRVVDVILLEKISWAGKILEWGENCEFYQTTTSLFGNELAKYMGFI